MHNCSDRVTERRDAIKNAKDAKNAKSANPWRLAFLAVLGRAGDLIGPEGGKRRRGGGRRCDRGQNATDLAAENAGNAEGNLG